MTLTPEIFAEIVARASTLEERLANGYLVPQPAAGQEGIQSRLERWRQAAANGDQKQFEKLLAMRGLDAETACAALGPVRLSDSSALPEWTEILRHGLNAAGRNRAGEATFRFLNPAQPWPFERLMTPFVEASVERLRARAGAGYELLAPEAHIALERLLLHWLVNVSSASLILEFSIVRLNRQSTFGHRLSQLAGDTSNDLYREYTERMLGGGLVPFFQEYSVLARAVARLMTNWVDSTAEFLGRLATDWNSLECSFQPGADLGRVEQLAAGLSDPHRGGRSVYALTFSSGLKLVYKPKSLETEDAYSRLLDWVNEQGISLPLKGFKALSRPHYGWAEFVRHTAAGEDGETTRFYRRCGMLLCLFYVLESTDVHSENLIAAGEHPILIDAETLITPSLVVPDESDRSQWAEGIALRSLTTSVLRVGMLPWWRAQADGSGHDPSALGAVGGEEVVSMVWEGIATDNIGRQAVQLKTTRNGNVPFRATDEANPGRYVEDVVSGFREMYELLLCKREELLAPHSPLKQLAGAPMRLVFRDTQTYFTVLKNSVDASLMRDGAERSVNLEVLSRVLLASESNARFAPFLAAEKRALTEFDIPFFTASPQSRALEVAGGETVDDCFSQSGYERVRDRLGSLDSADLAEQIGIIRGSFHAKIASGSLVPVSNQQPPEDPAPASESELLDEAVRLGRMLSDRAIRGGDGSVAWLGLVRAPNGRNYSFLPVGPGLADGMAGTALFLAALQRVTGEFRETALGTLAPVRRALSTFESLMRRPKKSLAQKVTLGATGLGSIVYAYTRAAEWLQEEAALDAALAAAALITPELIEADGSLDPMNGPAVAIVGLLALHGVRPDSGLLEKAIACRDQILRLSPDPADPVVLAALGRLHRVTGGPLLAEPAEDAGSKTGAAVDAALTMELADSLHRGIAGRMDSLVEDSLRIGCSDSLVAARRLAGWSMLRAQRQGGYRLHPNLPAGAFLPGFWEGISGIGYEFLRVARPGEFPSVLLWN
jgi:type 2 lantibiotic biosynthesis protein LanM